MQRALRRFGLLLDNLDHWLLQHDAMFIMITAIVAAVVGLSWIGVEDRCDWECYSLFGRSVLKGEV